MKKVLKSKHFSRSLGFIAALIVVAAVIFIFTRPLLAPDLGLPQVKNDITPSNSEATFNTDELQTGVVGEKVRAESYLIYNEESGEVMATRNPQAAVAIASVTKLMTAYVVNKYGNLNDVWAVTSSGTLDINPVLGLSVGDKVKIDDLVKAMLVGSANDAARSLGVYITSTQKTSAVELMNKEAKQLRMNSTHYENPIGFDSEQNYSTAEDLKKLLVAIKPIKLFSDLDRKQSYSFTSELGNTYSVKATNTLLAGDPEIHAIKTGFTDEAKGAMITSIHHENLKFVIIVLGSSNREEDTKLLKSQILSTIKQ